MNKVENIIVKGNDGNNYLARDFTTDELGGVGDKSHHFWDKLSVIPKDISIVKVLISEDVKTKLEEVIEA